MNNLAAHRALRSLSHPATLLAVFILLINDHILQALWPSWWTGKLSDVAWMVFAPPVAALLIAWIVPPRLRRQDDVVLALAMLVTGLPFAAMKTIPAVHAAALRGLDLLMGGPRLVVFDPTDVVALVGLIGAWWVWRRSGEQPKSLPARGWTVLALAALGMVATSPPVQTGVECLHENPDGTVTAAPGTGYEFYESADGGITWQPTHTVVQDPYSQESWPECSNPSRGADQWTLVDPNNEQVVYRFKRGESIARSEDGGASWTTEMDISFTQAEQMHYERYSSFNVEGPYDALFHKPSGNLILAMGHEGVLVRTSDGEWQWVAAGNYGRVNIWDAGNLLMMLKVEISLALALIFLIVPGLYLIIGPRTTALTTFAVILWIAWTTTAAFPWVGAPAFPLVDFAAALGWVPIVLVAGIVVSIFTLRRLREAELPLQRPIAAAIAAPILFLLPFVIWLTDAISYGLAKASALLLVAAVLGGVGWKLRRNHLAAPPDTDSPAQEE